MILNRALKSHLLRVGLENEAEPPDRQVWLRLLELVNRRYEELEAEQFRVRRAWREIEELHGELAGERIKLDSVLAALKLGVSALDSQGGVLFLNAEAERMLGWFEAELAGRPLLAVLDLTLSDGEPLGELQELVERGETVERAVLVKRKDGSRLPATLLLNPMLRGGELRGVVVAFREGGDGRLPETAEYPAVPEPALRRRSSPSRRRLKALVLVDEPVTTLLLKQTLTERGCTLLEAPALEEAWTLPADLVFLAWQTSGVDPAALCRRIRERRSGGYTYVVALLPRADRGTVMTALEAGVDSFLTHPLEHDELLYRLVVAERMALEWTLGEPEEAELEAAAEAWG